MQGQILQIRMEVIALQHYLRLQRQCPNQHQIILIIQWLVGGYITNTNPNTYYVDMQNTGNVKVSCIVIFDFQHPDGVGGLKSDRVCLPKLLNVGEVGRVKLQLSYYNVMVNEYRVTCSKWAFA